MKKNFKIHLFSLIILTAALAACKKNPPQYPTVYSNDGFLEYSKKFNKQLNTLENNQIQEYIRDHSQDFMQTNAGFYMTRTKLDSVRLVKDMDTIKFQFQIKNLEDSLIYDYESTGNQLIVLGQSSIMPGIEYGLKRMSEGEQATLLLPSVLAYGVNGDNKSIGADEPLVIDIKLEDIVNYE